MSVIDFTIIFKGAAALFLTIFVILGIKYVVKMIVDLTLSDEEKRWLDKREERK